MAYEKFIPVVWSTKLNEAYRKSLVFGNLVNTNYQGDVKYGNTVKINSFGEVTIGDYGKNGVGDPEQIDGSQTELKIDQAKYFNFKVEDIDAAQANVNLLSGQLKEAAYQLADVTDQFIANLYTDVDPKNTMGTDEDPMRIDSQNLYNRLVSLNVKLSEADVPKQGRWVVLPEAGHGLLQKDPRFSKFPEVLYDGYIGNVGSLKVFTSNNCPMVDGKYKIIAGHSSAISFASQIDSLEAYRPERFFADAIKGLQVYGAKLVKPKGIAVLTALFMSEV
ncbi:MULTISPECIES: P22 coat protein - protein 5 domain protein [Bacillus]|uniref:P22 coat protein - protein 5 domain protein n=1 Tax=Bacillus TaxID=1386 RepID=UPI000D044755|nr:MULTISPECIES: P22 coat protein - protein 5 domain protein [Bacillus]PRR92862.1 P22 coat protein - protein 5 domain protein [Bacillus sp. NMCN1]PRS29870.1 P22 coat protein - protein 5 domain protein [Bacillus pumilus]PRS66545.1 P22 coat protein - protein 5 domain protein [Bacillus pumilus]WBL50352.1 P22 coat protein - protein 5 domain protein [Bacillus altitudinis]